jgi:hypothetical protein
LREGVKGCVLALTERVKGCVCALGGNTHSSHKVRDRRQRVFTIVKGCESMGCAHWAVADGNGCREKDWLGRRLCTDGQGRW